MSVNLTPMADLVLATAEEVPAKTTAGLYLPDGAAEKPKVAKVLKVGKDVTTIKPKDRVVYKSYGSTEVKVDGVEYMLIKEEDILAILEEASK